MLWEPSEGVGSAEHRRRPGHKGVGKDVPAEYPLHTGKGIPDLCNGVGGGVQRHPDRFSTGPTVVAQNMKGLVGG